LDEIEHYGVVILDHELPTLYQQQAILSALHALGLKAAEVYEAAAGLHLSGHSAFARLFGPTYVRVYPSKLTVDGIHAAINCGWKGRDARGCAAPGTYPEQVFFTQGWLILVAGDSINDSDVSFGDGLIAHELVHNLTWGRGHLPDNVEGFSFVRYVGDEFAIRYFDTFGVQVGQDAYNDEASRASNTRWRTEVTADAVASWALDRINGPYAVSIADYVRKSIICDVTIGSNC